jgi:deoxyribodipyrimidine photo-lyase
MGTKALCWIRRDLRLHDHAALASAIQNHDQVYLAFIFDNDILDPLKKRAASDRRLQFIAESLVEIQGTLEKNHSGLLIRYGNPVIEIPALVKTLEIDTLYFNRDYTPYPQKRDHSVTEKVAAMGCTVQTFKDHVMVEPHEILTANKTPYQVFTPYSRAWRQALEKMQQPNIPITLKNLAPVPDSPAKSLSTLLAFAGFEAVAPIEASPIYPSQDETRISNRDGSLFLIGDQSDLESPRSRFHFGMGIPKGGTAAGQAQLHRFSSIIDTYDHGRNFPYLDQTSRLSVYIRHGCISIREMVSASLAATSPGHEKWLTELIWREFYQMIFFHYPEVHTEAFQSKFKGLQFPTNEDYLAKWKHGQTGFPLIDAAMRCLNETGWMHNRLRMIVASFLSKTLLVDWKRGERYFSWKLLDYELASNNGGWQWAVGIGCDAAPYFRIFNPTLQSEKYDPNGDFIKQYCPELKALSPKQIHNPAEAKGLPLAFRLGVDYPKPIVDYKSQRQKALALYKTYQMSTNVL